MRKTQRPLDPNARLLSIDNATLYADCCRAKLSELRKQYPSLDVPRGGGKVSIDRIELDRVIDLMKSSEN